MHKGEYLVRTYAVALHQSAQNAANCCDMTSGHAAAILATVIAAFSIGAAFSSVVKASWSCSVVGAVIMPQQMK
jgi:hypothetical protein